MDSEVPYFVAFVLGKIRSNGLVDDDALHALEDEVYPGKGGKVWWNTIVEKPRFATWKANVETQLGASEYAKVVEEYAEFCKLFKLFKSGKTEKLKRTWFKEEHDAFLRFQPEYGNEWQRMENVIPTRDRVQIRTHAQKFAESLKSGHAFPQLPYASWSGKNKKSSKGLIEGSDTFKEFENAMDSVLQAEMSCTGCEEDVSAKMRAAFNAGDSLQIAVGQESFLIDEENWARWMESPNGKTVLTAIPLRPVYETTNFS